MGAGQVDWKQMLLALEEIGYSGTLMIERETGKNRMEDVRAAISAIQKIAQELNA